MNISTVKQNDVWQLFWKKEIVELMNHLVTKKLGRNYIQKNGNFIAESFEGLKCVEFAE